MRRATAAALGTVIGTALLVTAKYGAPAATAGAPTAISAGDPAADGNAAAGSAPPSGSSSAAVPGTSGTPAASAAPTGAARTTAAPQPGHSTPAAGGGGGGATTAPPPPSCTSIAGSATDVGGPGVGKVTVTIKVCNGVIASASSSLSQSNYSRNTQALPALNALVPQYYKTNISAIYYSNATYTSTAYRTSLQSAMTAAKL